MNYFNEDFKQEMKSDQNFDPKAMNYNQMNDCCVPNMAQPCPMPVYECPQERVCHRYICYDVPHVIPCNTRIINHHVYRHTYQPVYTCCEENVVSNVYDRNCCM
ncbi:MAG: hypothetical protein E7172_00335 [Firmicutes bacterium]|nr:hypothetical protein [Bacillota bacterium]